MIDRQNNFRLGFVRATLCILGILTVLHVVPDGMAVTSDSLYEPRPSVLIIDSSLGDADLFRAHWMGDSLHEVAREGTLSIETTVSPLWWTEGDTQADSPATFFLADQENNPITSDQIVWALDRIYDSGAQSKTVIVSVGPVGLEARRYVQDLADTSQSSRADIVGLVFLGTPHQGYSGIGRFPLNGIWSRLAGSAGLNLEDLIPESEYIYELNKRSFPGVVRSVNVFGAAADFGFGLSDGAGIELDYSLPTTVTTQSDSISSRSTISQSLGLSDLWEPFARTGQSLSPLDRQTVAQLTAMNSYITNEESRIILRDVYQKWFPDTAPVTHMSTVLTIDVSGSMRRQIENNLTMMDAAILATDDFLVSVASRAEMNNAIPESIEVFSFNREVEHVASGFSEQARDAVRELEADGFTDMGAALDASLDTLFGEPRSADKRIILLSDGLPTAGLTGEEIMDGPVARAKDHGVVIDTIAFGIGNQSDLTFLEGIADATGGTVYNSSDTYDLRLSFLRARFSSLGFSVADYDLNPSGGDLIELGSIEEGARSMELGIIADGPSPDFIIRHDGEPLDQASYSVVEGSDGLLTVLIDLPIAGLYTLELSGEAQRAHVFAILQTDFVSLDSPLLEGRDWSSILLIFATGTLIVFVSLTLLVSMRARRKKLQLEQQKAFATKARNGTSCGDEK